MSNYEKKLDAKCDTAIQLGGEGNPTQVEGYYLVTKITPDTGYGPGKLHIFQTADGKIGVWGKTNSNRLLTDDLRGMMVRLTFTGMGAKVKGRRPAYEYELEFDRSNRIDVSSISTNTVVEESDDDSGDDSSYAPPTPAYTQMSNLAPRKAEAPKLSVPSPEQQANVRAAMDKLRTSR